MDTRDRQDAEIRIRRCRLLIRGRGGWSWGNDPHRYLEAALPAIEQAVQRALAEADLPDDVDVHLTEPVRLSWRRDNTLDDNVRQAFVAALRAAAINEAPPSAEGPSPTAAPDGPVAMIDPDSWQSDLDPGQARMLAQLLGGWSRSGRLPMIIASWPVETVRRWLAAVTLRGSDPDVVVLPDSAVSEIVQLVLGQTASAATLPPAGRLLVVVAALISTAGDRLLAARTLARAAQATGAAFDDPPLAADLLGPAARPRSAEVATPLPSSAALRPAGRDHSVSAVSRRFAGPGLPFLVLVQLGRIGYLDALWAVAAVAGTEPEITTRALVGGLAGKVLPPPRRGWSRLPAEADAVRTASGLAGTEWDRAAYGLRGHVDALVSPLQSALAALYADVDQVVLSETDWGPLCGEARGTLPIAWATDQAAIEEVLRQLGDPPCRRSDLFLPLGAQLGVRRAFPGVDVPALERHLGAAVGTALGSLTTELWGDAPDAPALAMDRLADLEVELRPAEPGHRGAELVVAIPRGQRWLDLSRAGLLDRWPLPWSAAGWELVSW
jgi:hypothetical protein